jgi:hypothetical protein
MMMYTYAYYNLGSLPSHPSVATSNLANPQTHLEPVFVLQLPEVHFEGMEPLYGGLDLVTEVRVGEVRGRKGCTQLLV